MRRLGNLTLLANKMYNDFSRLATQETPFWQNRRGISWDCRPIFVAVAILSTSFNMDYVWQTGSAVCNFILATNLNGVLAAICQFRNWKSNPVRLMWVFVWCYTPRAKLACMSAPLRSFGRVVRRSRSYCRRTGGFRRTFEFRRTFKFRRTGEFTVGCAKIYGN